MPIERQRQLAAGLSAHTRNSSAFVSMDPHAVVRAEALDSWRTVLNRVDAFFIGEDELGFATPGDDPLVTARRLANGQLALIALKGGAEGGRLVDVARDRVLPWRSRAEGVVDSTGAGDAFFGGFIAGKLAHGDLERALQQGVVSASFAIADWGARALLEATPADAERRYREWYG
jgi:ribokinase